MSGLPASVTLEIAGVASHIPPVGPFGSSSTSVTFHASESPEFSTSIVNCPVSPRFIVAGPVLSTIRLGAAIVSGGLMPHSPGSGSWNTPLIKPPEVPLGGVDELCADRIRRRVVEHDGESMTN